jgi:hypothetical protein
MNFTGMLKTQQKFRVVMKRKHCLNQNQAERQKVVEVLADNWHEAKNIAMAAPENKAFIVDGRPKEIR